MTEWAGIYVSFRIYIQHSIARRKTANSSLMISVVDNNWIICIRRIEIQLTIKIIQHVELILFQRNILIGIMADSFRL